MPTKSNCIRQGLIAKRKELESAMNDAPQRKEEFERIRALTAIPRSAKLSQFRTLRENLQRAARILSDYIASIKGDRKEWFEIIENIDEEEEQMTEERTYEEWWPGPQGPKRCARSGQNGDTESCGTANEHCARNEHSD